MKSSCARGISVNDLAWPLAVITDIWTTAGPLVKASFLFFGVAAVYCTIEDFRLRRR
jgi:hypothetical protein